MTTSICAASFRGGIVRMVRRQARQAYDSDSVDVGVELVRRDATVRVKSLTELAEAASLSSGPWEPSDVGALARILAHLGQLGTVVGSPELYAGMSSDSIVGQLHAPLLEVDRLRFNVAKARSAVGTLDFFEATIPLARLEPAIVALVEQE